ncbi:Ig-like domain-containing protein [Fictibacillus iocasae]|uniref:Ig-like domain-containing protein n=1 Tax=Fictibacillus iocasae TaxID=2715437 RepID=A0ABW2NNX4_9BACL
MMRKNWSAAFLAVVLVLGASSAFTATPEAAVAEESGTIVTEGILEDTIWTKDKSPYILPDGLRIARDKTLTIEPGVKVIGRSTSFSTLSIEGSLIANGTENERITFENMFLSGGSYPNGRIELTYSDVSRTQGYILQTNSYDPIVVLKHNSFSGGYVILSSNRENPIAIESNLFRDKSALCVMNGHAPVTIKRNTFDNGDNPTNTPDLTVHCSSLDCSPTNFVMTENNFLGSGHMKVQVNGNEGLTFKGDHNYWGTENENQIHQLILDGRDYSNISGNRLAAEYPALTPFANGWPAGNLATPTVQSITSEDSSLYGMTSADSIVQVWRNGELIGTGKPHSDGMYSVKLDTQLTAGDKLEAVAVKPVSGYVSKPAVVTVKPYVPLMYDVSEVTDQSESVSGRTTYHSTVNLFNNGVLVGSGVSDNIGKFELTFPKQPGGSMLEIVITTPKQNTKTYSIPVADKTAPAAPKVNTVSNKSVSVSGAAEPGADVTVIAGGKTYRGAADKDGKYSLPILVQNAGASIRVTAIDSAGNASPAVTVKTTRVAPNVPSVDSISNKAAYVTGTAERYAAVKVQIGSKFYTAKAGYDGKYKVVIPVQNTGAAVSVTAADKYGKVSLAKAVKVHRVAPNMPAVNPVRYTSTLVTGKTEPRITVYAKIGTKVYSAKSASDGTFKISIPKQAKGKKIYVTSKDAKSMISAARVMTVY